MDMTNEQKMDKFKERKTSAAIVTPLGEGGIGKIIVTGPDALSIVNKIFQGRGITDLRKAPSNKLYYGHIHDRGQRIDEVILNIIKEDDSFTGEDTVEINCHGGIRVLMRICECLQSLDAGCHSWDSLLSQSFENDKIDLIQKEALQEIVHAQTKLGVKVLLDQYAGALSGVLKQGVEITEEIRHLLNYKKEVVHIHPDPLPSRGSESYELSHTLSSNGKVAGNLPYQFPSGEMETDVLLHRLPVSGSESDYHLRNAPPSSGGRELGEDDLLQKINALISNLANLIELALETASFGMALIKPQVLIILGKPNVGKSTIINAILGEERMLVHHEAGTTRDYVSEFISVDGIPFELVDTAGVRDTNDMLEAMSIEITQEQLRRADKVIAAFDNSRPFDNEDERVLHTVNSWLKSKNPGDFSQKANTHAIIPVVNKCDLPAKLDRLRIESVLQRSVCHISALNKEGLEGLKRRLVQEFETVYKPMKPVVFNKRQYLLLTKADALIKQKKDCFVVKNKMSETLLVIDELKDVFMACLKGY
jgi:tRNA modification GTPase